MAKRFPMNANGHFCSTKQTNKKPVVSMRTTFLAEGLLTSKPLSPPRVLRTSRGRQSFPDKHKSGIRGSICKVFYLKFEKLRLTTTSGYAIPILYGGMTVSNSCRVAFSFTELCRHFRSEAWLQNTNTGGFGSTF